MKPPLWLKPRSSFPDFLTHKNYARERWSNDTAHAYTLTALALPVGMWAVSEVVDPNRAVSPIPVTIFAIPALIGQFFYFRGVAAENRMKESWEDFEVARQEELAAQKPAAAAPSQSGTSAEASATTETPDPEAQEQPSQIDGPLPQPPEVPPKSSDQN